jgi:hypothetical protein
VVPLEIPERRVVGTALYVLVMEFFKKLMEWLYAEKRAT